MKISKIQIKFDEIVFPDHINKVGINADGSLVEERHKVLKAVVKHLKKF